MHKYFIKTHWLVKKLFSNYIWHISTTRKEVHLTFDDGPHPTITPWVLDELKKHNAKATFFCIGKNVAAYPEIYQRILREGHAVGNHTHSHLNGWKVSENEYIADIREATLYINSCLFRPPYGRITKKQFAALNEAMQKEVKVIMWDVLSADFDAEFTPEQCLLNVTKNTKPGSIILFHDSEKAFYNLEYAVPRTLQFLKEQEYACVKIEDGSL